MRRSLVTSVLDQAALSAFNFLLSLMLIKHWSDTPQVFGVYAIVMAGSLTLMSVQNALVISHMTVLRPKSPDAQAENILLSMFWTVNAFVVAAAVLLTLIGTLGAAGDSNPGLAVAAASFVGSTLVREYTRSYHFSGLQVGLVLLVDLASLGMSVLAIAVVWYSGIPLTLDALFLLLAGSQLVASIPAILPHRPHFRLSWSRADRDAYRDIWQEQSRWALLGVAATEFQQRGYVFVIAMVFGPAHVALLQAAALLFRPVQLLTHAWGKIARVELANHFAAGRSAAARAFTLHSLAVLGGIYVAFLAALALAWPAVKDHIFQGQFADIEAIVILWSAATALTMAGGIFSVEAQSQIKFRQLSYVAVISAIACGAVLAMVVNNGEFREAPFAVIVGQLVFLILVHRLISTPGLTGTKSPGPSAPGAAASSARWPSIAGSCQPAVRGPGDR